MELPRTVLLAAQLDSAADSEPATAPSLATRREAPRTAERDTAMHSRERRFIVFLVHSFRLLFSFRRAFAALLLIYRTASGGRAAGMQNDIA